MRKIKERKWVESDIGDTETYRILENVSLHLLCSVCHKTIMEKRVIIAFCGGRGLRLHEKCWDGKGKALPKK